MGRTSLRYINREAGLESAISCKPVYISINWVAIEFIPNDFIFLLQILDKNDHLTS